MHSSPMCHRMCPLGFQFGIRKEITHLLLGHEAKRHLQTALAFLASATLSHELLFPGDLFHRSFGGLSRSFLASTTFRKRSGTLAFEILERHNNISLRIDHLIFRPGVMRLILNPPLVGMIRVDATILLNDLVLNLAMRVV